MTANQSTRDILVVAAIIQHDGLILAARRKAGGPSGGKWEFAGGKLEPGETPQQALSREIMEELGLVIEVGDELGQFTTDLEPYRIHLHCFWCEVLDGDMVLNDHEEVRWCTVEELNELDWALPDVPAVRLIQEIQKLV